MTHPAVTACDGAVIVAPGGALDIASAPAVRERQPHEAVAALLARSDAWHDADPSRRFSPAPRALARADAPAMG